VLAGTVSLLVEGEWTEATRGCYAVIPGGISHDFENGGFVECGFISINAPAGFEEMMPHIVKQLAERALGDVAGA
jgi:mannose-6-phosphate isomerase-like protein (cupin superfamily)